MFNQGISCSSATHSDAEALGQDGGPVAAPRTKKGAILALLHVHVRVHVCVCDSKTLPGLCGLAGP